MAEDARPAREPLFSTFEENRAARCIVEIIARADEKRGDKGRARALRELADGLTLVDADGRAIDPAGQGGAKL